MVPFANFDQAVAVTPSDSVSFSKCRALYVGGAGNAVLVMSDGTAVTFTGIPAGTTLHVACTRVNATSTTATAIVALY